MDTIRIKPQKLRRAIQQKVVHDEVSLQRYAIRMGNEMRSAANWRQSCNNYNRTSEGER